MSVPRICCHKTAEMNFVELCKLCTDTHLLDSSYGVRELADAFVRVNVVGEIYDHDKFAQSAANELVYDEFVEVLARIFARRVWEKLPPEDKREKHLEGALEAWIGEEFLPAADSAIEILDRADHTGVVIGQSVV